MKKTFTDEQIVVILRGFEPSGKTIKEYRQLQQENARLKRLLAERDLEIDVMKEVIAKKW